VARHNEARESRKERAAKRPLHKRILRIVGIVLAVPLGLVLLLLLLLHTGPGQRFVAGKIQQRVGERVNGSFELGELDFALGGKIALRNVSIRDEAGDEVIGLATLEVVPRWGSLLEGAPVIERIALDGVHVHLVQNEDGSSNLKKLFKKKPPKPPPKEPTQPKETRISIEQLHIGDVDVTIEKPDGTIIAVQDFGLDGSVIAVPATKSAEIDIPRITLGLSLQKKKDGLSLEVSGIETGLKVDLDHGAGSVVLARTKAHAKVAQKGAPLRELDLDLEAVSATIEPGQLAATVDKLLLGALVLQSLEVKGRVDDKGGLEGDQKVQIVGLKLDAERLNKLIHKKLLASDIEIETTISGPPEKIELLSTIKTAGGELKLSGVVNAAGDEPEFDLSLVGSDIESAKLVISDKLPPIELSRLQLGLRGKGATKEDAEIDIGLRVGPTKVGKYALDELVVDAHFDGGVIELAPLRVDAFGDQIIVRGKIDIVRKLVDARLTIIGDVGATLERLRQAGLKVKTRLPAGAIQLHDGVLTVDIKGHLDGELEADVAIKSLAVAGGTIVGDVHAKLFRNVHAGPDDKKVELRGLDGVIQLNGVNLKQVAALRGKKLEGMTGTVSGKVVIDDVPNEPLVTYDLQVRAQATDDVRIDMHKPTLVLQATGKATRTDLALNVNVTGVDGAERELLLTAKVNAPLQISENYRGVAPHRPLDIELKLDKRPIKDLLPYLPKRLLVDKTTGKPKKIPDADVSAHIAIKGTGAAPQGDIDIDVHVPALADKLQRVLLDGKVKTEGRKVVLSTGIKAWLDADRSEAIDGTARVELSHSPLLPGPRTVSWAVDLDVKPQDLAKLPLSKEKLDELKLAGIASAKIHLVGNKSDIGGKVKIELAEVTKNNKGPFDSTIAINIKPDKIKLDVDLDVGRMPVVRAKAELARGGKGLLLALKDKTPGKSTVDKLGNPALKASVEIPDHSTVAYVGLQPALAALPGMVGGQIDISGDLKTPVAKGGIAYKEFPTADEKTGRMALNLDVTADKLAANVELGNPDNGETVNIDVGVPRAALAPYLAAKKCYAKDERIRSEACATDAKLPLSAKIDGQHVELKSLVPAMFDSDHALAAGQLNWSLDGDLKLDPQPRFAVVDGKQVKLPMVSPESTLAGKLQLVHGLLSIPDTKRQYHDVKVDIAYDQNSVTINGISVRESDRQRKNRSLDVVGKLSLNNFRPEAIDLHVSADEFLIFAASEAGARKLGHPDAPRGSLSTDIVVSGKLDKPVKVIDVEVKELELLIPDRFRRAHQPEEVSSGDVIYLPEADDEEEEEKKKALIGKLPLPPKKKATKEQAKAKKPASEGGLDVTVRIPNKIHILQFPMNLYATGEIKVNKRGDDTAIDGKLKMVGGDLSLGGRKHPLAKGHFFFDKEHPGGEMDLLFARQEHNATLRDISQASGGETVDIHLQGPLGARRTTLGGAGSPGTLFDLLSVHNAGRQRYVSEPDMPASMSAEFPQHDNLLLLSYLAVNVPHLLFLDKVAAWSDAYDGRATNEYGRIQHYQSEGYSEDGDFRVRALGRREGIGRSNAEVQLDYLFSNTPQTAVGVGVSAGNRLGGGPGVFFEWSSKD
jgi:hypothetical protein